MVQLSINEVTTYRWSFEEDVERYVAAGIPAIGVWRPKLSDFGEEKGVELLVDSGLKVSNLLWAGGFTGSDGRSYRDSVEDASEAIRLAGALQADCLVVYSGSRAGHTHQHARRLLCDALEALLPLADQNGVTLAIEPMHAACATDWTFLTSLKDAIQIVDKFRHERIKIVYDTYHLGHEPEVLDRLPAAIPHIAIVHLGDGESPPGREQKRTRLGNGNIPLRHISTALLNAGYDGYFDVELIGEEIEAADYPKLLEHSKRAVSELCACPSH
jgi:sugar phosphate isomerase/epimerase